MKIAVYGSATVEEVTQEIRSLARDLGREIGKRGHTLITGACPGLPYEAVLGANDFGITSTIIGFSPARSLQEHIERFHFSDQGFSILKFIPQDYEYTDQKGACFRYRNVSSAAECDAAVFIRGGIGSLNELTNCLAMERPIGILTATGGLADFTGHILGKLEKRRNKRIIYEEHPTILLDKLGALYRNNKAEPDKA